MGSEMCIRDSLEFEAKLPAPMPPKWVPVIPDGYATQDKTWKRWMFTHVHVGILGAHRNAEKTYKIAIRHFWWRTMKQGFGKWIEDCVVCARFRKIPQRQLSEAVIPVDVEDWEEVMIDVEEPRRPCDKQGNRYVMTYVCCLSHGVIFRKSTCAERQGS